MAALGDKVLDGYMYPPWAAYSYPCSYLPAAKAKGLAGGGGWRHRRGDYPPASPSAAAAPSSFPGYGQLMAAEYFDSYQKAQLMALLSQASSGLAPRPRRAGSRDAAVQVNPRRDVSVQCSLGRRTLPRRLRDPGPPAGSGPEGAAGEPGPPPPKSRGPEQEEGSARQAPQPPPPEEEGAEDRAAVRASWEPPGDGAGLPPREAREGEGAARRAPRSPEPPPPEGSAQDDKGDRSPRSPEPAKERLRFQFLEQKYGYYHCKECNIRWESAYVWCVQGTNKVYFKQFCRTCQKSYNPYRVEDITCQSCKQTRCSCSVKLRHVDPKRPHRQDLCGRCKGKRLSCDSTFSFKYII
ncbi:PREDICTED: zygote arrest protein 1 [Hipposideros armiger]|uniref:Zygote arrest protein 1 n=1 Tax=Hipposideros armiger TaxID=186990 RepID=A0A8B7PUQ9_HIPAR|nr:PREDICTED: zygote arrest protein 1 [Hipposideros armiger]